MSSIEDTIASLQVTFLASLPDSLQPKAVYLNCRPSPKITTIGKGVIKPLAILKNDKGETVLDSNGCPFIMGNGGISNFTNYNTEDGLPQDNVVSSCVDHYGNIWFGTLGGGVSRYDGKNFINFSTTNGLASNEVNCIIEDKYNNLWFVFAGNGVCKYNGKEFVNYSTSQGLVDNNVTSILEDRKGNIWFGTENGVSLFDGNKIINLKSWQFLLGHSITSITEDNSGYIWFGTDGDGIYRFDGNKFTNFNTVQGLASNTIVCSIIDNEGNLWFGTDDNGVSRFDGKNFVNFSNSKGLTGNFVISMKEDNLGNIWFGTNNHGVSRYDGKTFTNFTVVQGLANNNVWSITEDKVGNIWFTTGAGISRYNGKSFINFTTAQGLISNNISSIAEDKKGNLWFGTIDRGMSYYDGTSFRNFTTSQGLSGNNIYCVYVDKSGKLWFSTGKGVSYFDRNKTVNYTTDQGLGGNVVMSIAQDKEGNMWFGTGYGVSRFDGKSFVNYTSSQGLSSGTVWSIRQDKAGNLWFGTIRGLSQFNGNRFVNFTKQNGLAGNNVMCITEDHLGNIFFATNRGLSKMTVQKVKELGEINSFQKAHNYLTNHLFENLTNIVGFPYHYVTDVIEDNTGKFYIGGKNGISQISFNDSNNNLLHEYNSNIGYPVKDVQAGQNTLYKDRKGIIWIATSSEKTGLVRFDPNSQVQNLQSPKVLLQNLKINEFNICWYKLYTKNIRKNYHESAKTLLQEFLCNGKELSDSENNSLLKRFGNIKFDSISSFYPLPIHLVIPYEHNSVTFDYVATETGRNFMVQYQYKLDGYDKDWSTITNKTSATFGNIFEGTYTFKLKARSPEGVWSEPITYTFRVLPPWYRTWWAYTMYVFLLFISFRFYLKWRERGLKRENEKLEHTVELRTAEVVAQKKKSDELLLNILPAEVAEELKAKGEAEAKQIDEVTVLFTDFKGFTQLSEKLSPKELVSEINTCFKAFDHIMHKHGVEKIKTIGDAYMAAGGLPIPNNTHAEDVVKATLEIQQFMHQHKEEREKEGKLFFEIRIGIHTGPVVAGIVGVKKFAYDIWGDTVNTASRMESSGEAGKINISETTYALVKDKFSCTHRGKISAKGKGEIDMYFVN